MSLDLEQIERRCEAATKGPWFAHDTPGRFAIAVTETAHETEEVEENCGAGSHTRRSRPRWKAPCEVPDERREAGV